MEVYVVKTICMPVTMMKENAYFFYDENTKDAVVVDPGGESKKLNMFIKENGLKIHAVLLTHGHFDHIQAADKIKEVTGAKIIACQYEEDLLNSPKLNMSKHMTGQEITVTADIFLNDGDVFTFADHKLQVMYTPGHTKGGVSFYSEEEGCCFVGDTLFCESVGRSDFEGGSTEELFSSIKDKLFNLPNDTIIYSGHGQATTIGHEKKYNPFVKLT